MILRNDTAYESQKFAFILDHITGNVDQTHLVVQFIHMFRTFVQIYDTSRNILYLAVDFVQQLFCLALALFAYNQLNHWCNPPVVKFIGTSRNLFTLL